MTDLTPEQKALLSAHTKKWIEIGHTCKPADRPNAEKAVALLYKQASDQTPDQPPMPAPTRYLWALSPISGAMAMMIAEGITTALAHVDFDGSQPNPGDEESLVKACISELADRISEDEKNGKKFCVLSPTILADVKAHIYAITADQIIGAFRARLIRPDVESFIAAIRDSSTAQFYWFPWYGGHLWAAYPAHLTFYRDVLKQPTEDLTGLELLARSSGHVWFGREFAMICERPTHLQFDDRDRLHNDTGPAVAYPDGWAIYRVHGVEVPASVVLEPEKQSVEDIQKEENAEVRRIRIEKFAGNNKSPGEGWVRYLQTIKADLLDRRYNAIEGTEEVLCGFDRETNILVCHCPSTARIYAMPVPNTVKTCDEAQSYLWSGNDVAAELLDDENKKLTIIGRT